MDNAKILFNDLKPILLLVFGIGIGCWIGDIIANIFWKDDDELARKIRDEINNLKY